MATWTLLLIALVASSVRGSENVFSVYDDVLAFPQYEVVFSESYILIEQAQAKLHRPSSIKHAPPVESTDSAELATFQAQDPNPGAHELDPEATAESYERLMKNGRPYLCTIPQVERQVQNTTETKPTAAEQDEDEVRAMSRGLELLQDMGGKPCLFYTTGWWSYSFCYNTQVRQFHALPPGTNGAPLWPPTEDQTAPAYILGKVDQEAQTKNSAADGEGRQGAVELQRKAETSYLVQKFEGGTPCDLTGKDRKIEIQFHCNAQTTDRIGWIKETATCAYMMVIYTPRLCYDVAFLPPKASVAHPITCQEILMVDEVEGWNARRSEEAGRKLIDDGSPERIVIGNVEVGAMKDVGRGGKKIERGRVVLTTEEKAETVVIQKDGRVEGLSKADLKKMDLNPEDVEAFTKELKKLAGTKDWRIDRLDDVNGQVQLRGVVASEADKKKGGEKEKVSEDEAQDLEEGSEEEYKEEI